MSMAGTAGMTETARELQALIEETPAMLWRGDHEGRCVFLNRAQREFWGVDEPILDQFNWSSTLLPDDWNDVFGPFEEGMKNQRAFSCEGRYRRADGAIRVLRTMANPYFAADGTFAGMVGVNEDVTDLREAQSSLDRRNRDLASSLGLASAATSRFELATRISGLAMSEHDENLRYTWIHNLPQECLGQTPCEFFGDEMGSMLEGILRGVLASGQPAATEIDFVVKGRRYWAEVQACLIESSDNRPRIIASGLDITARKLNETKLEVLAGELAHRVKNIYAVTQAIVQQSARSSGVPADFARLVSGRLTTLARAQDMLLASSHDRVSVRSIVEANVGHLGGVNATGDDGATVPGQSAPYLALALNELGTNSLKYGALAQAGGSIQLEWQEDPSGDLQLTWKEHAPAAVPSSDHEGFGTALLTRIFARATNGRAERKLEASGLEWSAVIPSVDRLAERKSESTAMPAPAPS
jgi:PAS domain S-box-containing protein